MNIEITVVNGKQFVSGLRWHKLRRVRSYKKDARDISKKEGWDMVTIRRTRTSIMAGYAPRGRQGLKGMYSLAAALGGQLGENWIGIFSVGQGRFALAAVNNGEVMPGYDTVGDFDTVNSLARECYGVARSNDASDAPRAIRTIAPMEFGFADEHLELKDILVSRAVRREHRLRPVKFGVTKAEMVLYGSAGLVLLGAAYGGQRWWDAKKHAEEVEAAQKLLQEQQAAQAATVVAEIHPWEQLPRPEVVLDACSAHLDVTHLAIGGWLFKSASCGPGSAEAIYDRNESVSVKDFIAEVKAATGGPPVIDKDEAKVSYGRVMVSSGKESLRPLGLVLTDVSAQLVHFPGTSFQINQDAAAAPTASDEVKPSWLTAPFEITTPWPPATLLVGLDTAGIRIDSISTTLDTKAAELKWTLKGNIYGTR